MSKKRLNYDDPRWQGMVWSNPLNIKSGDYLNDYYQALDAMRANALNATTGDVRKGKAFSQVDAMKAQMEYASTLEERAYNEYLYNQYESPAAMVKQYDEAGLNPMMLAGGNSVGGSVNATSGNSMSLGRGTESARGLDIMSMILNAVMGAAGQISNFKNAESQRISANANATKAASDVAVNDAEIAKKEAETNLINKQAEGLDIDITWKDKMYDINYKVLVNTNNLKELEYKYESTFGWRARKAELDKIASEIEVNKAEFKKLTSEAWRNYTITPHEVKQIDAMVDKINSDKAMVDLEAEGQMLENQDSALGLFAHQVATDYGIDLSQTDLIAHAMYLVVQRQNDAITDDEFAEKMSALTLTSKQRGTGDRARGWVGTVTGAVGTVLGAGVAAYVGSKGGKGGYKTVGSKNVPSSSAPPKSN